MVTNIQNNLRNDNWSVIFAQSVSDALFRKRDFPEER
jgi:hypothetical protein